MKEKLNLYTETKSDINVSTSIAKSIIQKIGESFLPFFCLNTQRKKRTTKIFEVLTELGDSLDYKVYSHGLSKEFLDKHKNKFKNREWLYDLQWYVERNDKGYMPLYFPLIVECEWEKRKSGDKNDDKYSGIKYDFQKLLISNAYLRLMLFPINGQSEAVELRDYFQEAIRSYKCVQKKTKFLFIGFCFQKKDFYYFELIK